MDSSCHCVNINDNQWRTIVFCCENAVSCSCGFLNIAEADKVWIQVWQCRAEPDNLDQKYKPALYSSLLVCCSSIIFNLPSRFPSLSPYTFVLFFSFYLDFFRAVCLPAYLSPYHIHWSSGEEDQSNYSIHFISNQAPSPSILSLSLSSSHILYIVCGGLKADQSIAPVHPLPIQSVCFSHDVIFVFSLLMSVWMYVCISFYPSVCLSASSCGILCLSSPADRDQLNPLGYEEHINRADGRPVEAKVSRREGGKAWRSAGSETHTWGCWQIQRKLRASGAVVTKER